MTKQEIIKKLSDRAFISVTNTTDAVNALPGVIVDALKTNGEALIPGIGKLVLVDRPARTGRNPKTGEPVQIPASKSIKFKAVKAIKEAVS